MMGTLRDHASMAPTHDLAVGDRIDSDDTTVIPFEDPSAHQYIYVQIRPRHAAIAKCVGELNTLLDRHSDVTVDLVGVSKDAKYLALTLAVDLGLRTEIPRHSPTSIAAFTFMNDLYMDLFEYLPNYVQAPSEETRRAAADLPAIIGKGLTSPARLASAS